MSLFEILFVIVTVSTTISIICFVGFLIVRGQERREQIKLKIIKEKFDAERRVLLDEPDRITESGDFILKEWDTPYGVQMRLEPKSNSS